MEEEKKILTDDEVLKILKEDNPKLYEQYKRGGLITPLPKIKEIKPIKQINLSPLLNQTVLGKLGNYISERMNIDNYYLVEVIYILLGETNEEELAKNYPDYPKVKKKLEKFNKRIQESKTFYDLVQDKTYKTKYKTLDEFQKWVRTQQTRVNSKIPLIQLDIYKLFVYLLKNCSVQSYTIRQDMLKVLEYRDNARIDLSRKRRDTLPHIEGGN
jgi:hypothetical protein